MHDRKSISIIRIIRQGKLLKKILLWADANALSCINTAPVTLPYENMQLSTRNSIHTNTGLHLCHFISRKYTTAWHFVLLGQPKHQYAQGIYQYFFSRLVEKNSSHFQKEWDYYSPLMKTERRWRLLQFTFLSLSTCQRLSTRWSFSLLRKSAVHHSFVDLHVHCIIKSGLKHTCKIAQQGKHRRHRRIADRHNLLTLAWCSNRGQDGLLPFLSQTPNLPQNEIEILTPSPSLFLFSSRDSNINISTEEGGLPDTRKWNLLWPFCRIEGKERGVAGGGTRELFEGAE